MYHTFRTGLAELDMPDWDFNRNITSMRLLTELAAEHGAEPDRMLKGTGITADELASAPQQLVSAQQELQLIDNIVAALGHIPALGVQAGQRYHFTAFGPLGFALVSSKNIRAALEAGLHYIRLTFAFCRFKLHDNGDRTHVVIDDRELPDHLRPFIVERDSACLVTLQRDVFNQLPVLRALRFAFAPPGRIEPYEAFYNVTPAFNTQRNEVILDRERLLNPLPQANTEALKAARTQCEALLNQRQQRDGLAAHVRSYLAARAADMPTMPQTARSLHMIPRTLRRRLLQENTSFTELRDEARQALAEEYLAGSGLPVEHIAERLGYTEAGSFIKAYKRWHGVTPYQHRRGGLR